MAMRPPNGTTIALSAHAQADTQHFTDEVQSLADDFDTRLHQADTEAGSAVPRLVMLLMLVGNGGRSLVGCWDAGRHKLHLDQSCIRYQMVWCSTLLG
jgi:hypothetical protein